MAASNVARLPASVVDATLAAELEAAGAWAKRLNIPFEWDARTRQLRVTLEQPETGELFYLGGQFDDYRLLPPSWRWYSADWSVADRPNLSPNNANARFGSSQFISQSGRAVICAAYNRLAHKCYGGPHSDWGDPINWATAGGNHIRATTIGDMLQAIRRDLLTSRGRLQ